ncbi:hypothetical protein SAMN05216316_2631 [Nitrosovibrio sp. Nv6]|nr:hypothetical protein SAMN05216316_2631 [Nitrosovibrio sp. Nv6]
MAKHAVFWLTRARQYFRLHLEPKSWNDETASILVRMNDKFADVEWELCVRLLASPE